jgi:hypothetical protein
MLLSCNSDSSLLFSNDYLKSILFIFIFCFVFSYLMKLMGWSDSARKTSCCKSWYIFRSLEINTIISDIYKWFKTSNISLKPDSYSSFYFKLFDIAFNLELCTSYLKTFESSILSDKSSILPKLFLLGKVKLAILKAENSISFP